MYMHINPYILETQYPKAERDRSFAKLCKDFKNHGIGYILSPERESGALCSLYIATYDRQIDVTQGDIGRKIWEEAVKHYQKTEQRLKLIDLESQLYDLTKSELRKGFLIVSADFLGVLTKWLNLGTVYSCDVVADTKGWAHHKNALKLFPKADQQDFPYLSPSEVVFSKT